MAGWVGPRHNVGLLPQARPCSLFILLLLSRSFTLPAPPPHAALLACLALTPCRTGGRVGRCIAARWAPQACRHRNDRSITCSAYWHAQVSHVSTLLLLPLCHAGLGCAHVTTTDPPTQFYLVPAGVPGGVDQVPAAVQHNHRRRPPPLRLLPASDIKNVTSNASRFTTHRTPPAYTCTTNACLNFAIQPQTGTTTPCS